MISFMKKRERRDRYLDEKYNKRIFVYDNRNICAGSDKKINVS